MGIHCVPSLLKSVLAIFLIFTFQGCSSLRQEYEEPDIRVLEFSRLPGNNLLDQRFSLLLSLTNPNDLELDVKGLAFVFDIGGTELIRGTSNDVPLIKPYGEARFTVQGSANLVEAMRLLKKLSRQPDKRLDYTLHTTVELAKGWPSTFRLTRDGQVGLEDLLKR